jgi:hypothetical protein
MKRYSANLVQQRAREAIREPMQWLRVQHQYGSSFRTPIFEKEA